MSLMQTSVEPLAGLVVVLGGGATIGGYCVWVYIVGHMEYGRHWGIHIYMANVRVPMGARDIHLVYMSGNGDSFTAATASVCMYVRGCFGCGDGNIYII